MTKHVSLVICMPRWARVEKVNLLDAKKVVDDVFALGVSLCSSDYITKEDLRSFRLASIDDDNDTSPSSAPTSGVGVHPSLATDNPLVTPLMTLPAMLSSASPITA